ncbi:MAG: hypothetical protein K6E43_03320 [Lachnospiraceae bacterium]|nr:hypothetical protein [Lachnospiraceae bacterium]
MYIFQSKCRSNKKGITNLLERCSQVIDHHPVIIPKALCCRQIEQFIRIAINCLRKIIAQNESQNHRQSKYHY